MSIEKDPVTCIDVVNAAQAMISRIEEQASMLAPDSQEAAALALQALDAQFRLTQLEDSAASCSAINGCLTQNNLPQCQIAQDMYLSIQQ